MLLIRMISRGLVLLATMLAVPAAATWQELPDALALQAVGSSIRLNGTPMQIRAFASAVPMETLLRQVQAKWERPGLGSVSRTAVASWTVLNQEVDGESRSFQVRPAVGAGVEGFVAVTSPKLTRTPQVAVRLPPDITAVSIIDSLDQNRVSQQVIAVSRRSAEASAQSLDSSLKAQGWQRHVFKKSGQSVVFAANKGSQQFDATLSSQKGGSIIMMNTLKN